MNSPSPPRLWLRAAAAAGGLLALAAMGFAADRQRLPPASSVAPLASSAALGASSSSPAGSVAMQGASRVPSPSASASSASPASPASEAPRGVLPDGRVVLNVATEDELRTLSGIGPSRARAIVALRQRQGRLRAVSDLLRVKGIGRKTLARLAPRLVLDPPPS